MKAIVIGAGPAGLMAAEQLAMAGHQVTVFEAKPSPARKFLMAGKSGLNLTFDGDFATVLQGYGKDGANLRPILSSFDNRALRAWSEDLGQRTFVGSTGRVFPKDMKASPLLRAWLARLDGLGVRLLTRHRWVGREGDDLLIKVGDEVTRVASDVRILACGGASWPRLGSDGAWADWIGTPTAPFAPSNAGLRLDWSDRMKKHMGAALKGVAWRAGQVRSRGEAVISHGGLEGGGVYPLGPAIREGATAELDLLPDLNVGAVAARLEKPRGKASLSNHVRKVLRMDPVKLALANEWAYPLPQTASELAAVLKNLTIPCNGLSGLEKSISSVGGVPLAAVDETLMLRDHPGTFCAGEMLDWDAPTGGWLLTACFATGRWAGYHAARLA